MIYGYDAALEMPTMEVYDSGLLGKYIDAAKEDYERGLAEQKEFATKYGDFTSLISKDVDWWDKNVTKPIQDFVSGASELGIDMRSPEFRSAYMRMVNKLPYAGMTQRKNQAKIAQKYSDSVDALKKAGLWNPDYEKFLLGGKSLGDWNTEEDGAWTRSSAEPMTTLTDFAKKATEGMKPGYLRTSADGLYDYNGITRDDVKAVLGKSMKDYLESNSGKYNLKLIADRDGLDLNNPDERKIAENTLQQEAADRSGRAFETREVNEYGLTKLKHQYDKEIFNLKQASGSRSGGGGETKQTWTPTGIGVQRVEANQTTKSGENSIGSKYIVYQIRPNTNGNINDANVYYAGSDGKLHKLTGVGSNGAQFQSDGVVATIGDRTYVSGQIMRGGDNGSYYYKHGGKNVPINTAYLEVTAIDKKYVDK